jgi:hypothetical protein
MTKYETAEVLNEDGTWRKWPDLSIRLFTESAEQTESAEPISVVWTEFDKRWIERGDVLPFSLDRGTVWSVEDAIPMVNHVFGKQSFRFDLVKTRSFSVRMLRFGFG